MKLSSPRYDWKRSAQVLELRVDEVNLSSEMPYYSVPSLSKFDCVVLLGRPGLGKTDVLREMYEQASIDESEAILVDLKGQANWDAIRRRVFEHPVMKRWLAGSFELTLFLDSLDECLLRAESLGQELSRTLQDLLQTALVPRTLFAELLMVDDTEHELARALERLNRYTEDMGAWVRVNLRELPKDVHERLPNDRLAVLEKYQLRHRFRLRVACRTNDWAFSYRALEDTLVGLWGASDTVKAELQPLNDEDIRLAIEEAGVEQEAFLAEVHRAGITLLVNRPRHLLRLLLLYQRGHLPLPNDDLTLNEQAALESCKEWDEERLDLMRRLNARQRLEVASRLAAGVVLCGKRAIFLGVDVGGLAEDQLGVSSLVGFHETVLAQTFEVGEPEIRDTLTTELFRAAGKNETVFDHLTTAEFLTARYLCRFPAERALELLSHPDDPERRVVPPLKEVAVWLARQQAEVLDLLLERDPVLLLRSDAEFTAGQRRFLVQALLDWAENQRVDGYELGELDRPERLYHDGLFQQLRPYIVEKARSRNARYAAFRLVEAVSLSGLTEDLLNVVADITDEPWARQWAVKLVLTEKNHDVIQKLLHLLKRESFSDPDDGIRGKFLRVTWPGDITASTLITLLKKPESTAVYSTYRYLLGQQPFWEASTDRDLPILMEWLSRSETLSWVIGELDVEVLDYLLSRVWRLKDNPRVKAAILGLIRHLIESHTNTKSFADDSWFTTTIKGHAIERRWLISALVESASRSPIKHLPYAFSGLPPLRYEEDARWALTKLEMESEEAVQEIWIDFVLINMNDIDNVEHLFRLLGTFPVVTKKLRREFVVDLDSEEAESMKQHYQWVVDHNERLAKTKRSEPLVPAKLVLQRLARLDEHPEEWWDLARLLTLKLGDTHYSGSLERDIRTLPGWDEATEVNQQDIIRAATGYVLAERDYRETWLAKDRFNYRALAGYQALYLLVHTNPSFLSSLTTDDWERWVAVIIDYPNLGKGDEGDYLLLLGAYSHAKATCLQVIQKLILFQAKKHDRVYLPDTLEKVQDNELRNMLCSLLTRRRFGAGAQFSLLSLLLEWGHLPALDLAKSWIRRTNSPLQLQKAELAARALLLYDAGGSWEEVWTYLEDAPGDAKQRYLLLSGRQLESLGEQLSEAQLIRLYQRLLALFPREEDPVHSSGVVYDVSPRDQIAQLRDGLLSRLARRGTLNAVRALEELLVTLPGNVFVQIQLREARELFRRNFWTPLKPSILMQLANTPTSRYVRSASQLLDAIIKSLERLNVRLQGETPLAPLLWNELESGNRKRKDVVWMPRSEERLSDLVRWHLDHDLRASGVILNREVQIRPGEGAAEGERTDIQVEAIVPDVDSAERRVGVIIEVKGQWNKDLLTALNNQLVQRYLNDNPGKAGLYLVGFFRCPQWNSQDNRLKAHIKATRSAQHLKSLLDRQASVLSRVDRPVRAFVLNAALR